MNENLIERRVFLLVILAGAMGAAGVALAARAAHGSGNTAILNTAALFLIMHAALLVAIMAGCLALAPCPNLGLNSKLLVCGWLLGLGTSLFSADLARRGLENESLFTGAAPVGGILMILGWILLAGWGALAFFRLTKR